MASNSPSEYSLNLAHFKPGYIMYYDNYDSEEKRRVGAHIAMVQDVKDMHGNGEIELNEILLIESTYGEGIQKEVVGNAYNQRTLKTIHDNDKNWIVVRLK